MNNGQQPHWRYLGSILAVAWLLSWMLVFVVWAAPTLAQQQPDPAFGTNGRVVLDIDGFADQAHVVGLQSDGRILVAGRTHTGPGPNDRDAVIVRLLPDGSLDNTFGGGGVVRYTTVDSFCFNPEWFFDLLVLDDDTFLAAGFDQRGCDAPDRDFLVVRYRPDGTVEQVFSDYPAFHNNRDEAQAVAVQPDGKVVAAGWAQTISGQDATMDVAVARWNADGTLDTSFDGNGEWLRDVNGDLDRIDDLLVWPDGKIVLAGRTAVGGQTDWLVIRLNPDGSLDTSFDGDGIFTLDHAGFNDVAGSLLLQDDGKILVGGNVSPDGATTDALLIRLNPDGTLDPSFGTGGQALLDQEGQSNGTSALAWHGADKILVAGWTSDGTTKHFALTRVLGDGSLDQKFGSNGWITTVFDTSASVASDVAVQPDQRIVLAGHTESVPDVDDERNIALARYDLPVHIYYVDADATGANDGSSWADAYTSLQSALVAAQPGDQVWVAAGVYYPTAGTDRNVAFTLKNGVEIYGGFAGTETALDQRDWQANLTVLSGDIDHNDKNADGNFIAETWNDLVGSNSYNVVRGDGVDSTAVLDGFIITAGRANSNAPGNLGEGGGIYLSNGASPTLRNLTLSGSYVYRGGGGLSATGGSQPVLTDVIFTGNKVDLWGGGMYVENGSATLTRVTFDGNQADDQAGGLYTDNSPLSLTNVTFRNNSAVGGGGAEIRNGSATLDSVTFETNTAGRGGGASIINSSVTITNSTFTGNTATGGHGGGLYVYPTSVVTLTNSQFVSNTATGDGGGIYLFEDNTLTGTDLTFQDNTAGGRGGGLGGVKSNVTLTQAVFENNTANGAAFGGGGLFLGDAFWGASTATLTDVIFTGNTATDDGGGGIAFSQGTLTIRQGLIANNSTPNDVGGGFYLIGNASATLENVTISGNTANSGFGGGGIYHQGDSLTLRNVTIAGNSATSGQGEGLYVVSSNTPLTMVNTILADNGNEDFRRSSSSTSAMSVTYSLIENQGNAGLTHGVDGNLIGVDPLLAPLADNGGFSQTHALQPGSPAVDAGSNGECLTEDQRGVARPIDGDDDGTATCDMGAYEAPPGSGPQKFIYLPLVVKDE